METRENTSIHIYFDAGGSWKHVGTVAPCLGLEMDKMGSEWNPRYARFGHGFEDLHNFVPKSMQGAVGGQLETVGHQVGDI